MGTGVSRTLLLIAAIAGAAASSAAPRAETVFVKYRGPVDLASFRCTATVSSFVHRVCHDARESYMLINLSGVGYHHCGIDARTVSALTSAESVGRHYNQAIKGRFDCRVERVPVYPSR